MTEFLLVMRRDADASPPDDARRVLQRAAHGYAPFVGGDYDAEPAEVRPSAATAALVWSRQGMPAPLTPAGDRWAVSAGHEVASDVVRHVRRRAARLVYERPVWGQYVTVLVERWNARVTAWGTTPAFESIHWGEDADYVYLSNRPLLVALALADGRPGAVRLSHGFLREYLHAGYSLTGQSAFEDVRIVPVDQALAVEGGRAKLVDAPSGLMHGLSADHTPEEGADALAEAMQAAMDRTEAQLDGRPVQLRMSGGMDSRVLLGLTRGRGLRLDALTYGVASDLDVRVARMLTDRAGVEHRVTRPSLAEGSDDDARVLATLRASRGVPPSEAHTGRYLGADVAGPGWGVMLGQWPLYKGGAAKKMRYSPGAALGVVLSAGADLLAPRERAHLDGWLRDWFETLPAENDVDALYQFSRQFRSGRWMHGHISLYAGEAMIAYPLGDAELTAVADTLTAAERVSHRAAFGALTRVWPEGTAVPLDGRAWRFEANGADEHWSGPYYAERHAPLPEPEPEAAPSTDEPVQDEHAASTAIGLASAILGADELDAVAALMSDDMLAAVRRTAESGAAAPPAGMDGRTFRKLLWRVRTAQLWWSRGWLRS